MQQIGRYRVLGEVARGGMGVVFRAEDPAASRVVAIKVLLGRAFSNPNTGKRFRREAEALARVIHPNVVRFHSYDATPRGEPYLVMEWVEGESLQARLDRGGPLDPDEAVRVASELCGAVTACHAAGVLHRDLKPDNVLVTQNGLLKLTDFGLVRDVDPSLSRTQLSSDGRALGTPGYWSPEQGGGRLDQIGVRTDVYGLGATLFALLTGRPPQRVESLTEVFASLQDERPAPSSLNPAVPSWLDRVVARALAIDPEDRFANSEEFAEALAAGAASGPAPRSRRGGATLGLAFVCVSLVVAMAFVANSGPSAPAAAPAPTASGEPPAAGEAERTDAMARALALLEAKRYEEAIAAFTAVSLIDPDFAAAYVNRGRVREAQGDHRGAIEDYDTAIQLKPDFALAYNNRGGARRSLGDMKAAIEDFDEAIRLQPRFAMAYTNRGAARGELGDQRGAIEDYDTALRFGANAAAHNFRGVARAELGDLQGALEDLNTAIRLDPELASAYLNRGAARAEQGDLAEALVDSAAAIRLDPENAHAYTNRAALHRSAGNERAAIADYTEAIRLEPQQPNSYSGRGRLRLQLGESKGAVADLRRSFELKADLYVALFYAAASGDTSPLSGFARGSDWGAALARHSRGELTSQALLSRARAAKPEELRRQRLCEAHGYIGLKLDLGGDRAAAIGHYEACVETGVTTFLEYVWAKERLRR